MHTRVRFLVIVNVYRPDLGGGVLFADLCEGLAARGVDVTVKCAYSYYPEWRDKSGENDWKIRSTTERGVHIERHGIFIPSNPNSLLQRLLYEASFFLSLRRRMPKRDAYNAVMVFCPLVGAVAYGIRVGKRIHAPVWLNVQDLAAQAAAAGGISGSGRMTAMLIRVQNALFSRAQYWTTISPSMLDTIRKAVSKSNPAVSRMRVLPNWLHASMEKAIREATNHATESDDATDAQHTGFSRAPIRLLYSGNIGAKQDLLRFIQLLSASNWRFCLRIQGDGARARELERWIADRGDERISFHSLTDEPGLARALQQTDFYLITEKAGAGSSFVPSKMIPALASGVPLIAVCDATSPLGRETDEFQIGIRLDWSTAEKGIEQLGDLTKSDPEFGDWKKNASARALYYGREAGLDRYESFLQMVVSGKTASD